MKMLTPPGPARNPAMTRTTSTGPVLLRIARCRRSRTGRTPTGWNSYSRRVRPIGSAHVRIRTLAEVGFHRMAAGAEPPRVGHLLGPLVHLSDDGLVRRFLIPPVRQ